MRRGKVPARLSAVAIGAVLALGATACGGDRSTEGSGGGGGGKQDIFVFGTSADPKVIDGAYVSDGETLRVVRQIFEGLVTNKAGTTEIVPSLAERWESSDSKAWTFHLKSGVKFHDGTDFNAEAVCKNFERWYNFSGAQQNPAVSYYWQTVFGGFKETTFDGAPTESLYSSCEASDPQTVVINLTSPSASFLSALSLPSFYMASPTALQQHGDAVEGEGDNPSFTGKFGLEHPTGTGPYKFKSWARGDSVTLERNDAYHGAKAKIKTLVFKTIPDGPARRQALESGTIDGFDQVEPADVSSLQAKFQVQERAALNAGWVGFTTTKKPLDNPKIRQAIAHALNRQALVQAKYPPGSKVADQFMPAEIQGYAPDVPKYDYDPEKAKQLIAESGVRNPTLEFWYPSDVTRPYMPDPAANFQAFKADLEAVGFKVVTKTAQWTPDYLDAVDNGQAALHLIGWNADFADADNFIGVFFQGKTKRWGFDEPAIRQKLTEAEQEIDPAKRTALYQEANRMIMEFLPGVPYVHTKSFVALRKDVQGFVTDPLTNENFSTVSKG